MSPSDSLALSVSHAAVDEAALAISRALTQLADDWERAFAARSAAASQALGAWTGPKANRFGASISTESSSSAEVVGRLRSEANRWAAASLAGVPSPEPWPSSGMVR